MGTDTGMINKCTDVDTCTVWAVVKTHSNGTTGAKKRNDCYDDLELSACFRRC